MYWANRGNEIRLALTFITALWLLKLLFLLIWHDDFSSKKYPPKYNMHYLFAKLLSSHGAQDITKVMGY